MEFDLVDSEDDEEANDQPKETKKGPKKGGKNKPKQTKKTTNTKNKSTPGKASAGIKGKTQKANEIKTKETKAESNQKEEEKNVDANQQQIADNNGKEEPKVDNIEKEEPIKQKETNPNENKKTPTPEQRPQKKQEHQQQQTAPSAQITGLKWENINEYNFNRFSTVREPEKDKFSDALEKFKDVLEYYDKISKDSLRQNSSLNIINTGNLKEYNAVYLIGIAPPSLIRFHSQVVSLICCIIKDGSEIVYQNLARMVDERGGYIAIYRLNKK